MARSGDAPLVGRGDDFYRSFLVGYGALFFAPHPVSGALFLLATFAADSLMGVAVLVGLLVSTGTAHLMRRSRVELERGLHGFNGALVAFALFSYRGEPDHLFPALVVAAAITTPITIWLMDGPYGRRLALPYLSLPSLVVAFPALIALLAWAGVTPHGGVVMPPYLVASSLYDAQLYSQGMWDAVFTVTGEWVVVVLFLAGFCVFTWRLLVSLLVGVVAGSLCGFAFLGFFGASSFMFVMVTAAPVFVAISVTFTGSGIRSLAYGLAGVVLSFFVWFYLGLFLADFNLPFLTAPFCLTTLFLLLLLRLVPAGSVPFLPTLIPLHRIGSPEAAIQWARDRAFGVRYWDGIASLGDRSWSDFTERSQMLGARELLRTSRRVVFLTGAGISTESGIPDYRSASVAWKQYDPEHFRFPRFMASEESRRKYWQMSQDFFLVIRAAQPNPAHQAIFDLERLGKLHAVITQNVDRLHQRVGVAVDRVIEIHGNEHTVSCLKCGLELEREVVYRWILDGVEVPYCPTCQGILKPDSIAFDQPMNEDECRRALEAVEQCDLLIVAGTSLEVQPVATLPLVALRRGTPLIMVNLAPTDFDPFARFVFRGTCGAILPELCRVE